MNAGKCGILSLAIALSQGISMCIYSVAVTIQNVIYTEVGF